MHREYWKKHFGDKMIEKNDLENLCKQMTFETEYSFLEAGKDDDELKKVAEAAGIAYPSPDLAFFKGKFAFANRTNLNGCSLPKAEVKKSLPTLFGKAIDFDHIRTRIVGYWLNPELIGETIYAYGVFFKSNLADDYDLIKKLIANKNLCISFEAYGQREFNKDGTYNLKDICWAGGALLINTKPAFPGADVLELSNKRVLEFASVMTEPENYIVEKSAIDILAETLEDVEFAKTLTTKDRNALNDSDFAVVITKKGKDGKTTKIRKFPIHDEAHVRAALSRIAQSKVKEDLAKLGVNITTVKRKILARAKKLGMSDYLQKEKAQFRSPEMDTIHRLMGEVKCPMCACQGSVDIDKIDFPQNKVEGHCWMCNSNLAIDLTPDAQMMPDDMTNSSKIKITIVPEKTEESSMSEVRIGITTDPKIIKANEAVIKVEGDGTEAKSGKEEFKADANDTVVADKTENDVNTDAPTVDCPNCGSTVKKTFLDAGPYAPSGKPDKSAVVQKSAPAKAVDCSIAKADSKHLVPNAEGKVCCAKCGTFVQADAIKLVDDNPAGKGITGNGGDPSTLTKVLTDTPKPSGEGVPAGKENQVKSTNVPDKNTKNFANDQYFNILKVPQAQLDDLKTLADVFNSFPKPSGDGKDASTITAAMVGSQIVYLYGKARDEGKTIGTRRSLLGDFAKDMSDDDVLNDTKFENASLKKENAELKAGGKVIVAPAKEVATVVKKETSKILLEIGSKDKVLQNDSEIKTFANNVRKRAFNV